jgi:hypothetical protein
MDRSDPGFMVTDFFFRRFSLETTAMKNMRPPIARITRLNAEGIRSCELSIAMAIGETRFFCVFIRFIP